jgi:UDP-N-acetyl-D-galactosamine dehydrogenase
MIQRMLLIKYLVYTIKILFNDQLEHLKRSFKMNLYEKIKDREEKISLVGLGYVGMPIAIAFAKKADVLGFDISKEKVELYKKGIDPTKEVGNDVIKETTVEFTADESKLKEAKFHIVAVPTPVNADHTPDLRPVESASKIVGRNLTKGSIVVFESTVYPGVTEEICIPILEKESGMKCGEDFKVGYSPERINPGDKVHRLETIVKVVSGMDEESLDIIAKVYELVVDAGVHRAKSIKVAEAAKVIENSQRDINIAFMNELSIIFNKMGIDTKAVLKAAGTKWNFLKFFPGLVGGHCIGVDPYYLTYKAEQLGYHSQIILSGRRINDDMGKYVVENLIKNLIKADVPVKGAKVTILGFTFKENCPDTRNTRVIDIVNELKEYGINPMIADPEADAEEAKHEYGIVFDAVEDIKGMDAVVIAVGHDQFLKLSQEDFNKMFKESPIENRVLLDIKGILDRKEYEAVGYRYWRL